MATKTTTIKVTFRARQLLRIIAALTGHEMQTEAESIFAEKLKSLEAQNNHPHPVMMVTVQDSEET